MLISSNLFAASPGGNASTAAELTTEIVNANANTSGIYTITITADIPYSTNFTPLSSDANFATVARDITIYGGQNTITATGPYRGFFVGGGDQTASSGTIRISELTIASAKAKGGNGGVGFFAGGGGAGMGGGLFVAKNTTVLLDGVTFSNCVAQGGDGGAADISTVTHYANTGGGGGGMFGDGGKSDPSYSANNVACGGGGGGFSTAGSPPTAGTVGGVGGGFVYGNAATAVNGGAGGTTSSPARNAQAPSGTAGGGGGGGGPNANAGGAGGFGGGSGGTSSVLGDARYDYTGNATGGFGGGGGGHLYGAPGGFGGGGASDSSGNGNNGSAFGGGTGNQTLGGGGAGLGGAIFIQEGGSLEIQSVTFSQNTITGGTGANSGVALGKDIFMQSGGSIDFNISSDYSLVNPIASDQFASDQSMTVTTGGLTKSGTATLTLPTDNTFTGTVNVTAGTLSISDDSCLGHSSNRATINGGTLTTTNTMTIPRTMTAGSSDATFSVPYNKILTLSGAVSGSGGVVKSGSGKLILTNDNTFSGGATINSGILSVSNDAALGDSTGDATFDGGTLNVTSTFSTDRDHSFSSGGGTVDVDEDVTYTIGGQLTSTGAFTKTGTGILVLNGDSTGVSHTTTLSAGQTYIHGGIRGNMSISSGATLSGNGSVGTITENHGTISPGASIGTLTIAGDLTLNSDGTVQIEIDSTSHDIINVGGTANLTGDLFIDFGPGAYQKNHRVDFLNAGTVSGTFLTVNHIVTEPVTVTYLGTTAVYAILTNGAAIPIVPASSLTGNEKAVADYLFGPHVTNPNDELFALRHSLASLTSEDAYKQALLHLSPVQFGDLSIVTFRNSSDIARNLAFPAFYCPTSELFFYATPLYSYYSQNLSGQQYGFEANTGGATVGINYTNKNHFTFGGMVGYTYTYQHWQQNAGNADIQGVYVGPYFGYNTNKTSLSVGPMFVYQNYDTKRRVQFTGYNETAKANFNSYGTGAHVVARTSIPVDMYMGSLNVMPKFNFDGIALWQDSIKEKNGSSANLDANSQYYGTVVPKAILGFSKTIEAGKKFSITPYFGIGYRGFFFFGEQTLTSGLQITPDHTDFTVITNTKSINQVAVEVNISAVRCQNMTLELGYEFNGGSGAQNQNLEIKFGYNY